jgi:hypothetical protein
MAIQPRDSPGTAGADLVPLSGDVRSPMWGLVASIYHAVGALLGALEGRLSLGSGVHASWSGNVDGQWLEVEVPAAADIDFAVPHGLGRVPTAYFVGRLAGLPAGVPGPYHLYDSPVNAHTDEVLWLRCNGDSSAGTVTALLWVV